MIEKDKINEYAIKLSGKAFLPEKLEIGTNYRVDIEGTITSCNESDKDDGSHLFTYLFKPMLVKVIDEKGKIIKAKDVRSRSQQLRGVLWKKWATEGRPEEFDTFYDRYLLNIIQSLIE